MVITNYKKYKKIKNDLSKVKIYNNNLDQISSSFLAHYILLNNNFLKIFLKILRNCFFVPKINFNFINSTNVYMFSVLRRDHADIFNFYEKKLDKKFDKFFINNKKLLPYISINNFFIAYKIIRQLNKYTFDETIYVFASILGGLNFYNYLDKNINNKDIKIKYFLSYNSSFLYEAILNVYLRKKIITYSMQHAFYYEYQKNIPYDVINHENCQANFLLQWSEYSINSVKKQLSKYTKQINFGYISEENFISSFSEKSSNIFVPLPRKLYAYENQSLIKILTDSRLKKFNFIVSAHPADKNNYDFFNSKNVVKINSNFNESIIKNKYLALISFNTSCLFLSALYDIPSIIYETKRNEYCDQIFLKFKKVDQLINHLKNKSKFKNYSSKLKKSFF